MAALHFIASLPLDGQSLGNFVSPDYISYVIYLEATGIYQFV